MLWSGFQGHQTRNQCIEVHVNKIAIHIQNNLNTHTHFYRKCTVSDEQRDYKSLASLEFRISKLKFTVSAMNKLAQDRTHHESPRWVDKVLCYILVPLKSFVKAALTALLPKVCNLRSRSNLAFPWFTIEVSEMENQRRKTEEKGREIRWKFSTVGVWTNN